MTSETVKQFLVGDGLDMSNFPALQQKIYSAYKSSQKVHSDMVMACYVGDAFQNMLGVGRLTLMTPLATFNLTSQFTKVFMCQGNFTQLDSCIINSTNPNIVAPPNDNSLKIKTCNQNSGKVVFTPSYVKAGMEDVIFISMLNCIPSRNVSAQEDENGNRFSYYYGYDLTSDSVSRFLKREFNQWLDIECSLLKLQRIIF
ncbi:hypothetical protein C9374_005197 [Naegleria lovaniensis]|uniref:Uncharacterized protein n=1 Tax=Naegleria lovaniensis TaxID=51637 RepID=A0AA88GQF5_NAELO|nr:uncharacterized protein C9374_005197 [Naegleria lovaniensis]KAG2382617.1 hypothetical protein C9374_005197 [Naegleria lovaniensis]